MRSSFQTNPKDRFAAGAGGVPSGLVVILAEKLRGNRSFAVPFVVVAATDLRDRIGLVEPAAQVDDAAALAAKRSGGDLQIDLDAADGTTRHGWSSPVARASGRR